MKPSTLHNTRANTPVPIRGNEPPPEFSMMMRLAPNGSVIRSKGAWGHGGGGKGGDGGGGRGGDGETGSLEEQAGAVAYVQRLVELVGELLGLESFAAMEWVFHEGRCLVFAEPNGETVALRPRADSNLQPLRESLGL